MLAWLLSTLAQNFPMLARNSGACLRSFEAILAQGGNAHHAALIWSYSPTISRLKRNMETQGSEYPVQSTSLTCPIRDSALSTRERRTTVKLLLMTNSPLIQIPPRDQETKICHGGLTGCCWVAHLVIPKRESALVFLR